jgi:NADPH2:quinone reductase
VEIYATALNRADLLQKQGTYPSPVGWPSWPGLELSGVIVDMGEKAKENSKFKVGDNVCALVGGGAYAEKIAVPYDVLMPIPQNITFEEASALPEAYGTSYLNLFYEGQLKAGQVLYVAAGASGLASVVIPMAKAFGARVITTVIDDTKIGEISHLGADLVVNTNKVDIADVLKKEMESGHSVDVAIDCLGGEMMGRSLHYLTHGARWIMIAALAGKLTEIDLKNIYVRNVRVIGSTLRSRKPEVKAQILSNLVRDVWPLVSNGSVKPTIYKVLPITDAEAAHGILYRGENTGKVVLTVG